MKRIILGLVLLLNIVSANTIYATFDVVAYKSASVAFSASGIVNEIFVDIGSDVKKGQKLAMLDNRDTKAVLNIYTTTLKYAKKDFERQEKIRKIIDHAKFDSYANKYESAKAQVLYQEILLDKTILKAPFDGVIISKKIELGDVVSGQVIKTAFEIQSKVKRKFLLHFDQKYNNLVEVGDTFTYTLDGDEKKYTGKISKIYPFADVKTRKIQAEVIVSDVLVGLFGDGYISKQEK